MQARRQQEARGPRAPALLPEIDTSRSEHFASHSSAVVWPWEEVPRHAAFERPPGFERDGRAVQHSLGEA